MKNLIKKVKCRGALCLITTLTTMFLAVLVVGIDSSYSENQRPIVTIQSPNDGQTVSGTVPFSATATDPDGSIYELRLYVDGILRSAGSSPRTYQWDTTRFENGVHILDASALDNQYASTVRRINVTVDNNQAPPEQLLFRDNFEDGNADGWTPVGGASNWVVLTDGSYVYATRTTAAVWSVNGHPDWSNYIYQTKIKKMDNYTYDPDGRSVGILFYFTANDSKYSFVHRGRNSGILEIIRTNPTAGTILRSVAYTLQDRIWYNFKVEVENTAVSTKITGKVWKQGEPETSAVVLAAEDASASRLQRGKIGLFSRRDEHHFDDVAVTSLGAQGNNTPPSVQIQSPQNGARVFGAITISANASDANGIDRVEFYIDNNTNYQCLDAAYPYTCSWDTRSVPNGNHSIRAKAYDRGSPQMSATHSVSVTVDNLGQQNLPPTVSITNPLDGQTVRGRVFVQAYAQDADGIRDVKFYIDGAYKYTDSTAPYTYDWDTIPVPDGNHRIKAEATDNRGLANFHEITVIVDNVFGQNLPPVVNIAYPTDGQTVSGRIDIIANAVDPDGTINRVEFYIDNSLKYTDTAYPYTYAWDTTNYTNATHEIQVKAFDNGSPQLSSERRISVLVNNTTPPPPPPGGLTGGSVLYGFWEGWRGRHPIGEKFFNGPNNSYGEMSHNTLAVRRLDIGRNGWIEFDVRVVDQANTCSGGQHLFSVTSQTSCTVPCDPATGQNLNGWLRIDNGACENKIRPAIYNNNADGSGFVRGHVTPGTGQNLNFTNQWAHIRLEWHQTTNNLRIILNGRENNIAISPTSRDTGILLVVGNMDRYYGPPRCTEGEYCGMTGRVGYRNFQWGRLP